MKESLIKKYYEKNPEGIEPIPKIKEIYELHNHIKNCLSESPKGKLLDIGCGKGFTGITVKPFCSEYHGLDISSSAIEIAKKKIEDGVFKCGTVTNLPYLDEEFKTIICSEVLEHVPNYKKAIKEISRVTKKKGTCIITTPNKFNPDMMLKHYLYNKYTPQIYDKPINYKTLIKEFNKNNFKIQKFFSFWFFPSMGNNKTKKELEKEMIKLEELSKKMRKPLGLYLFFELVKND